MELLITCSANIFNYSQRKIHINIRYSSKLQVIQVNPDYAAAPRTWRRYQTSKVGSMGTVLAAACGNENDGIGDAIVQTSFGMKSPTCYSSR